MSNKRQHAGKASDALAILDHLTGDDPTMRRLVKEARLNASVAQRLYALRTQAGLSQAQLAKRVGTTQSVISRLEDADYEGHSLSMLQRIASALDTEIEVHFVAPRRKLQLA
jgi:ribosome-binding protein aMBF1 (putative translation factor)